MFLLPTLIDCGTFIAPQCSGAWFWCAIRCGHFVVLSMTGASKPRQESAAAVCEQMFARRVELLHRSRSSGKLQARTWQKLRIPSAAKRHVAHRASPRMPHPHSLPCALHTSTRVQSTLDTHAPRVRVRVRVLASPVPPLLSCGNTRSRQKAKCELDVTGHWLIVGRPAADTSGMHTQYIALAIAAARDPHALPTRCACHPPPPTLSPYAER